MPRQIDPKKLGSNLGQLSAENRVKRGSVTQSQAKRINEIAFPWLFRDQGVRRYKSSLFCPLRWAWTDLCSGRQIRRRRGRKRLPQTCDGLCKCPDTQQLLTSIMTLERASQHERIPNQSALSL